METRKIQTTASGSFFLTLPKSWVNEMSINRGDELVINQDNYGNLYIRPMKNFNNNELKFVLKTEDFIEPNSLERMINSAYIQGTDITTIVSEDTITPQRKKLLKEATTNLIGAEISEEFANEVTIRVLVDPVKFPLNSLIKRIFTLVASMHNDAMKSFFNKDEALAVDVINREHEVDKLFRLMLRQLNLTLTGRVSPDEICTANEKIDCVIGLIMSRDLSKKAHSSVEIAKQAINLKDYDINAQLRQKFANMSKFILKMQQNAILAFFKNDFIRANDVINSLSEVREIESQIATEILKNHKDINIILGLLGISKSLKNIAKAAASVAGDLQAKHNPMVQFTKSIPSKDIIDPLDIIANLGYDNK